MKFILFRSTRCLRTEYSRQFPYQKQAWSLGISLCTPSFFNITGMELAGRRRGAESKWLFGGLQLTTSTNGDITTYNVGEETIKWEASLAACKEEMGTSTTPTKSFTIGSLDYQV